jgi:hypothetical protein
VSSDGEPQATRKNRLVLRAAQERVELANQIEDFRRATQLPELIKAVLPAFAAKKGLPLILDLLRRYPIITTALSFIATRFRPTRVGKVVKAGGLLKLAGLLKLGSVLFAIWRGWSIVRKIKSAARRLR